MMDSAALTVTTVAEAQMKLQKKIAESATGTHAAADIVFHTSQGTFLLAGTNVQETILIEDATEGSDANVSESEIQANALLNEASSSGMSAKKKLSTSASIGFFFGVQPGVTIAIATIVVIDCKKSNFDSKIVPSPLQTVTAGGCHAGGNAFSTAAMLPTPWIPPALGASKISTSASPGAFVAAAPKSGSSIIPSSNSMVTPKRFATRTNTKNDGFLPTHPFAPHFRTRNHGTREADNGGRTALPPIQGSRPHAQPVDPTALGSLVSEV